MSSKVGGGVKGGLLTAGRHDWGRARAPNLPSLKIPGPNHRNTRPSLCFSTKTMSPGRNQSVHICHIPYAWLGRDRSLTSKPTISPNHPRTVHLSGRKAYAAATPYAPSNKIYYPPYCNTTRTATILWWEFLGFTREPGYRLRNPDSRTAQGPSLDTQEIGLP